MPFLGQRRTLCVQTSYLPGSSRVSVRLKLLPMCTCYLADSIRIGPVRWIGSRGLLFSTGCPTSTSAPTRVIGNLLDSSAEWHGLSRTHLFSRRCTICKGGIFDKRGMLNKRSILDKGCRLQEGNQFSTEGECNQRTGVGSTVYTRKFGGLLTIPYLNSCRIITAFATESSSRPIHFGEEPCLPKIPPPVSRVNRSLLQYTLQRRLAPTASRRWTLKSPGRT